MARIPPYNPMVAIWWTISVLVGIGVLGYQLFTVAPFFIISLVVGFYIFIVHHKDLFAKQTAYGLFLLSVVVALFHIAYFISHKSSTIVGYVAFFGAFCVFCTIVDFLDKNPYQQQDEPLLNADNETQTHDKNIQEPTDPQVEPTPKTEPTPPPKYLLPFPLKDKPSITVNKSLYGEFAEHELANGIVKCSATYLKQQLKSDFDFEIIDPQEIISNFHEMYSATTQKRLAVVNGLGVAIHQCVWRLMVANTGIDNREYLPFGTNYAKHLAEIFQNFDETSIATGIQIYIESLMDYYLSKIGYYHSTVSTNHDKKNTMNDKTNIDDEYEDDDMDDEYDKYDEVENTGNHTLYNILLGLWGAGMIAQYWVEDTYDFNGGELFFIWLIGFAVTTTAVAWKKEKFFTLIHTFFMLFVPFAFVFWASVVIALFDNQSATNIQNSNPVFNQAIDDIQSKGVANMHQTQTHQNVVGQTYKHLGNNPSDKKLESYLQKMVDDTNPNLPIMVEQNVRADSMYRIGKTLIHYFTITDMPSAVGTNFDKKTVNEFKKDFMASANFCQNHEHILKYGVNLSFYYSAVNRDKLFDIIVTPQDCGY